MKILYKDELGKEIHPNEPSVNGSYHKVYIDSRGLVKREDLIRENRIVRIDYYLDDGETNETILHLLAPFECTIVVIERESFGEFLIEHEQVYWEGKLSKKYKQLLLGDKNLCSEEISLTTGVPLYQYTEKSLFFEDDENEEVWAYWDFIYNEDGSLEYIRYSSQSDFDTEHYSPSELRNLFSWPEWKYDYYLSAKLLPNLELFHQAQIKNNSG